MSRFEKTSHSSHVTIVGHFDATKLLPESTFSNWTTVPRSAGEDQLAAFVRHNGPVQIGIDADIFKNLDEDHHITPDRCGNLTAIDHSLGIVGYNSSSAKGDYWIVKRRSRVLPPPKSPGPRRRRRNSWGDAWQDHGFIYVARGVACGNIFGSGGHVYTYGDPAFYYEA